MVFTSWAFLAFLPIVLLVYHLLPKSGQVRNHFLLAASFFFYGWWNWKFVFLVAFCITIDYLAALAIERVKTPWDERRHDTWLDRFIGVFVDGMRHLSIEAAGRRAIVVSVAVNLSILGFFKYAGFFSEIVAPITHVFGLRPEEWARHIILPLGISFHIFQSMAYVFDVYRGLVKAERSLPFVALYVMYFPQLVAGPIERAPNIFPQLRRHNPVTTDMISEGLGLMLTGFFKKVVMAGIIVSHVDAIFHDHWRHLAGEGAPVPPILLLCSLYLFTWQIYFDFAGYTDIARGCSKFFGINIMRNFDNPYLATNITQFWKGWHISMTSWFRDYLYAALKGSRRTEGRIHYAIIGTMALAGLWHGASWAFIVWGVYHGLFLSIERLWNTKWKKRIVKSTDGIVYTIFGWLYVIHVVAISLAFFRGGTLENGLTHLAGIFGRMTVPADKWDEVLLTIGAGALTVLIQSEGRRTGRDDFFMAYHPIPKVAVIGLIILLVVYYSDHAGQPFIYFQF